MKRALLIGMTGTKYEGPVVPLGTGCWRCTPEFDYEGRVVLVAYANSAALRPIALFKDPVELNNVDSVQAILEEGPAFGAKFCVTMERVL